MKVGASIDGDLAAIATEILQEVEAAVTHGVFAAGRSLRDDWRGQIRGAGLGSRLANSVRQADFPRSGTSLRAASLVWTKAPDILHAFDGGVLIRGKEGLWLAIPLPAAGANGLGRQRITSWRWEQRTGMRLRFVYRRNGPSLLVADDARLNSRGLAAAKGGRRRRDGVLTGAQTVPVFLLLRQVKMPKKLDLDGLAREATARLPGAILGAWRG
ncbi:DUF6441 family protein [Thioclava sp. FR2]|uniref:DUF6441 family protein n=1 Tax=Thioclava sp. FR2 TaxID=3445780 RepID=UPI003EBFE578